MDLDKKLYSNFDLLIERGFWVIVSLVFLIMLLLEVPNNPVATFWVFIYLMIAIVRIIIWLVKQRVRADYE